MKQMSYMLVLIFATLITSCTSCKKNTEPLPDNPYGLPNATQEGKNFFACRINGNNFIANYNIHHTVAELKNDNLLVVTGSDRTRNNYFHQLLFSIGRLITSNTTYLYDSTNIKMSYYTDSTCQGISSNAILLNAKSGKIQLTRFDKTSKIVSGTFECVYPILNCDTLKITDGRFDFNYY